MKWYKALPVTAAMLFAAACSESSPTANRQLVPEKPALSRVGGAAFTTNNPQVDNAGTPGDTQTCLNGQQGSANSVNCNIYTAKRYVWINGGPSKQGAAGLSDGWYFFSVGEPANQAHNPADGGLHNLSDVNPAGGAPTVNCTTPGSNPPVTPGTGCGDSYLNRRFKVVGGEIVAYLGNAGETPHDVYPAVSPSMIRLLPYDDTNNNGGVYILAVCQITTNVDETDPRLASSSVSPSACKYDAFKVRNGDTSQPPNVALDVYKTANAQYTRTYAWNIAKSCTPSSINVTVGGAAATDCTVTLKSKYSDGTFVINGTIELTNNGTAPLTLDSDPTDVLTLPTNPATTANLSVSCPWATDPQTGPIRTVSPGPTNKVTCTYSYTLPSVPTDYTGLYLNDAQAVATVDSKQYTFPSNTVSIQFSENTTTVKTVNPCVSLSDDKVANAFSSSSPFCYSSFSASDNATGADAAAGWAKVKSLAPYRWNLVSNTSSCGSTQYTNTATYTHAATSDDNNSTTSTTPSNNYAQQTVTVNVYGCQALTIRKFFDSNGNGAWEQGEPELLNWGVSGAGIANTATAGVTFSGKTVFTRTDAASTPLPAGGYTISEGTAPGWVSSFVYAGNTSDYGTISAFTKGTLSGSPAVSYALNLPAGTLNSVTDKTVVFGNYCTNAAAGWTLGFWSNNNGQAQLATFAKWQDLVGVVAPTGAGVGKATIGNAVLNYKLWQASASKNGTLTLTQFLLSGYDGSPSTSKALAKGSYLQYQNWLLGAQSSNNGSALYMLSAQFSAAINNAVIGGTSVKLDVTATLPGTSMTILTILQNTATFLYNADGTDKSVYTTYIGYLNQINNKAGVIPNDPSKCPTYSF